MEWFALLIIAGLLWHFVGRHAVKASTNQSARPQTQALTPTPTASFAWPELGEFDFEVVGESFCQAPLKVLAGEHGSNSAQVITNAYLVPDDQNRHDNKAVRVDIGGNTVGHLSRDDARSFRRRLSSKKMTGATTSCKALIMGGHTNRTGEKMFYGVRLDIKPFET